MGGVKPNAEGGLDDDPVHAVPAKPEPEYQQSVPAEPQTASLDSIRTPEEIVPLVEAIITHRPPVDMSAPTSRTREKPAGEEEAAGELRLGEFQNVPTLTLSEARLLINAVMDHRKQRGPVEETETLVKTQDYLDVFARFKQKENIEAVEQMLAFKTELEPFERSQLGSLCCETAEEAKTLIPSLANKISDADLQELLDDITKLRNFTE